MTPTQLSKELRTGEGDFLEERRSADRALAHRDRQDDKFEAAYVAAMVKGHTEALR